MNAQVASQTTPVPESVAIVADVAAQLRLRPAAVAESLEQALFERLDRSVVEGTLAPEQAYVLERCLLNGSLLSLGEEVAGHAQRGRPFRAATTRRAALPARLP